jgi:putative membrane protein
MNTMNAIATVLASGGDGHGGWWVIWPLFWLAVIAGAIWFFARRRTPRERSGADRARDILAERFARGELTGDEYRERLAQLEG